MHPPQLATLLATGGYRNLMDGAPVFRLGQKAEAVFRVVSGEVHLYRRGQGGTRVLLYRAYTDDYFAEESLNETLYSCSAICIGRTRIQAFNANKLRRLLRKNVDFSEAWISRITSELARRRANIERLRMKSSAARIIHYLMTEGSPPGELQLRAPLSKLADTLELRPESLYRTLSKLENQGLLVRNDDVLQLII